MTAWDELLATTHPGREVEIGPDRWLILRRSWRNRPGSLSGPEDYATLTVELARADSPADPRRPPPDTPRHTQPEES